MKQIAIAVGLLFASVNPSVTSEALESGNPDEEQRRLILSSEKEPVSNGKSSFFRLSGMGMFAASACDVATTELGLRYPGVYEGNPIAGNRGVRVAAHALAPAVVWWTTEKMQKRGHGKLALALRVGLVVAYSYAAVHNMRMIHSQ